MHDLPESDKEEDLDLERDILEEVLLEALKERSESVKPKEAFPSTLFIFPLFHRPLFPGMATPIFVEAGAFYEALQCVAKSPQKYIGLLLSKEESPSQKPLTLGDFYKTGVVARILRILPHEQGAQVVLSIEQRFTVVHEILGSPQLCAEVAYHPDPTIQTEESKAFSISIISMIKELLKLNPLFKEELQIFLTHSDFTEAGKLADFAAALTTASRDELQHVLSSFDLAPRIDKVLVLLKKEIDLSKLQHNIQQKIEASLSKNQKEYFLREQLKTIKKELSGDKDEKNSDLAKFEERLKKRTVPPEVRKVIDEEMEKLAALDPLAPEYAICKNYLDWLTILPWGVFSEERHRLSRARRILDEDHYGLKDIKERILEFISVGKLSGEVKGSIICLVGPPGVGKTSIGKSIAHAINRKFFRFSVGGMRDEAEIKGHRRTYIGAMPGKLLQALKQTKVMNPVIMLDEVDKMGASYHGDPASALLEVLDPGQNKEFLDHYLDVPFDLSHILFIVTANVLDTIPPALRDRMDVLHLSGYILEEKVEIADRYLIRRHRKSMGLKATQVRFDKEGIRAIIHGYAREAGVRSLEGFIKKILRKVAFQIVSKEETAEHVRCTTIRPNNLIQYLGKPIFTSDRFYEQNPVGVATGLAWTAMGGAMLYIEAVRIDAEKNIFKLTGQIGKVMRESAEIAWSFVQSRLPHYAPEHPFFARSRVHLHVPEGATPKDGPSAGVTMATALLSLLMQKPVKENLAMTGELTLTGKVLPVGGIKEKIIAARRSGVTDVLLPSQNQRDYEECPQEIKEGITIFFVSHYDEVFAHAFAL